VRPGGNGEKEIKKDRGPGRCLTGPGGNGEKEIKKDRGPELNSKKAAA